jgi:hypothetical protein
VGEGCRAAGSGGGTMCLRTMVASSANARGSAGSLSASQCRRLNSGEPWISNRKLAMPASSGCW